MLFGMRSTTPTAPAASSQVSWAALSSWTTVKLWPVVDYKGFRIIIPIKEMMINLGRSPSGQEYADLMLRQNKILGNMLGADIDFVVRGIDSKTRSVVASRREAMMRKRQDLLLRFGRRGEVPYLRGGVLFRPELSLLQRRSSVSRCLALRPPFWPVIWLGIGLAMPHERFSVGDEVLVRILSVRRNSLEDLGIRADIKSTSENTDRDNLQKCRIQGKYAGKVTDVHKGVVYVRLANGVNAVAHSCYDYRMPGKKDDVSFASPIWMWNGVSLWGSSPESSGRTCKPKTAWEVSNNCFSGGYLLFQS